MIAPRDYRGLEVIHAPAAVSDAMVDEELEKVRESAATLQPVEGRDVAEKGDYATIDHEGTIDGKPFAGCDRAGRHGPRAGGLARGRQLRPPPRQEGRRRRRVRPRLLRRLPRRRRPRQDRPLQGDIKGLKTREAPALDDAFAKEVGILGVETVDQLRARMRADLEQREQQKADAELKTRW